MAPRARRRHTEAPAEKREFPPFQKDTFASQLVSLVIAFVALYLIVSRIALPRVGGVIDARAEHDRRRSGRRAEAEGRVRRRAESL